jgi:hypothetical protein
VALRMKVLPFDGSWPKTRPFNRLMLPSLLRDRRAGLNFGLW